MQYYNSPQHFYKPMWILLNFEFTVSSNKIYLTFYKSSQQSGIIDKELLNFNISLKDSQTILFNELAIILYAPVELDAITITNFKLEIALKKKRIKK